MVDEKTSKTVAGKAGRVLNDPASTADEKSVAGSALAQAGDVVGHSANPGTVPTEKVKPAEPKKLVRFRANEKSPSIDIQAGEYRRTFRVEDQPFEVEDDNELQMLRETGHFVEDKEAEREAREQEAEAVGSEKSER